MHAVLGRRLEDLRRSSASLGLVGAGFGFTVDPRASRSPGCSRSSTFLTIALGAMFFVLIQHLTCAGWSVTVRRTAEFFALRLLALIAALPPDAPVDGAPLPLAPARAAHAERRRSRPMLADHAGVRAGTTPLPAARVTSRAAHHAPGRGTRSTRRGGPHAARVTAEHGDRRGEAPCTRHTRRSHDGVMTKKPPTSTRPSSTSARSLYFLVWTLLAVRLFGNSTTQDKTKDPKLTLQRAGSRPRRRSSSRSALTFAAFDWVMSLEPSWFSTIFGVELLRQPASSRARAAHPRDAGARRTRGRSRAP